MRSYLSKINIKNEKKYRNNCTLLKKNDLSDLQVQNLIENNSNSYTEVIETI